MAAPPSARFSSEDCKLYLEAFSASLSFARVVALGLAFFAEDFFFLVRAG
jgi:hypothetical protein